MRSARHWPRVTAASLWLALGAAATAPGCSLLYDLNADQCTVDADCRKLNQAFPSCDAGVCVAATNMTNTTGGNAGTASDGGGPTVPEAGDGGAAGAAGASNPVECANNGDCIDANFGQPFVCQAGQCISLLTKECPLVLQDKNNLDVGEPIVFGAYALAPDGVARSIVTRNLELAVSEFTSKVIGLRGGTSGAYRPLVFVVCNSSFPENTPGSIEAFKPSLEHLVDTLHVPGIVSGLQAKDLQAVFSQKLDAAGTFVISPYEQDSELAALSDGGRLWHLLGATSDLAPAFGPLLKRTEKYLRLTPDYLYPSAGDKLRVAVVAANIASQTDVRDALLELPELADFDVKPFQVDSALLTKDPDVSMLASNLFDFAPNIIVALAGSEFIEGVFPLLENGTSWSTKTNGQLRPMYVLGSTMAPETWSLYAAKRNETAGGWKSLFNRIVGITYASATDPQLLHQYEDRLTAASGNLADPSVVLGSESVYDAAYLLIYAAAAAGQVPSLRGKDLANGMQRLVEGTSYDVGPMQISSILTALDNSADIGLNLTLGEPNWNVARGTRNGLGSVYCLNDGSTPFEMTFPLGPDRDVLRYDPTSNLLEDKQLPCINMF